MALALFDRVQETTTTTGTGSITLGGAVPGFQSFAVVGNENTCYYTIVDGSAWEVGTGTYSTSGPTLARTTVLSNSNGNTSPITLAAGTKSVFLTYPAGKSVNLNESGNVSPLGTVSSGVWQGSTVGVAYGGTGVTASSGANSVVLRDSNQNITVNRINQGIQTITASGGTTVLTAASQFNQALVGTGGQTFRLPDATTLTDTTTFQFNNNATGTLTIQNNAGTTVGSIASGGAAGIALLSNATVGGTWDVHAYIPENVTWGTNALTLGSTVISGGTWQGGTIQPAYGGTGLTSYTSGGAVYANSSSTLTSGTLPVTAGGTGATTAAGAQSSLNVPSTTGSGASGTWGINITGSAGSLPNAVTFNSGGAGDASGTSFNGAAARTISYNTIGAPSTSGTNASGTWSINVTGSAGSASSATTSTYVTSQDIRTLSPSSTAAARMAFGFTSWANNNSAPYADYLAMRSYTDASGGNDNLLMLNKSTIAMRVYQQAWGSATAYSSYADVLMSNNYNSYSPTLTGTGATGTWAINISGNAATATNASNSNTVANITPPQFFNNMGNEHGTYTNFNSVGDFGFRYLQGSTNGPGTGATQYYGMTIGLGSQFSLSQYASQFYWNRTSTGGNPYVSVRFLEGGSWGSWSKIYAGYADTAGSAGSVDYNALTNKGGGTGTYTTSGDYRAPIFYDSNDTGFYVDPNGFSLLRNLAVSNYNQTSMSYPGNINIGYTTYNYNFLNGVWPSSITAGILANCADQWEFAIHDSGTRVVSPFFFEGAGSNYILMGRDIGWGNTPILAANSFRAPIFYDSDDTGYYIDPNSTSNTALRMRGGALFGPNVTWGAYLAVGGNGHISGSYASVATTNGNLHMDASSGSSMYLNYYAGSNVNFGNGASSIVSTINTDGSHRATIFYDYNNTGYYGDFASTSNISDLVVRAGTAVANITDLTTGTAPIRVSNTGTGTTATRYIPMISGTSTSTSGYLQHTVFGSVRAAVWGSAFIAVGGNDSYPTVAYTFHYEGYGVAPSSWRAPIFYDSDNTAYYLDPTSTSNVSGDFIVNQSGSAGIQLKSTTGTQSLWIRTGWDGAPTPSVLFNNVQFQSSGSSGGSFTFWSGNTLALTVTSDYAQGAGSLRAPIFYDSNNTGYYGDFASTSNLNALSVATINNLAPKTDHWHTSSEGKQRFYFAPNSTTYYRTGGNFVWRSNADSGIMTSDGNGFLRVNSGGDNYASYPLHVTGTGYASGDFRAPIFYDSDNTSFYCDPNGTSVFSTLNVNNSIGGFVNGASFNNDSENAGNITNRVTTGFWQNSNATTGTGWPVNSGSWQHLLACTHSNDANYYSMQLAATFFDQGLFYRSTNGNGSTGWSRLVMYGNNYGSSIYGTIFYDSDNTGYYVDPNSTTAIRTVGDWRADSSTWTGEFSGKMQYHSNNWYLQFAGSMVFRNPSGTNVMTCDTSGNVSFTGNVTAYSDARIKENVVTIDSALDKVLNLRGVYYNKIGNPERRVGVIAQETETVLPEVVRLVSDTNPSTGQTQELLAVDYGNIAGLLIEATKEQNQEVVDLRNRVAQLESLIHKLIGD